MVTQFTNPYYVERIERHPDVGASFEEIDLHLFEAWRGGIDNEKTRTRILIPNMRVDHTAFRRLSNALKNDQRIELTIRIDYNEEEEEKL